jgi:hypothetical protein
MPEEIKESGAEGIEPNKSDSNEQATTLTDQEIHLQETESAAAEKGWKPEASYEGSKGGFVSAEEFLKREPLFDKIKTQSKELKGLKKTMDAMVRQSQTQVKAQVALELKKLKAAKNEAIEAGDVDKVDAIDAEIDQQKEIVTEEVAQIPDEVSDWIGKNAWFNTDPELNEFASAHNRVYIEKHPGDVAGSLAATRKAVAKAFPDHEAFVSEKKPTPPPPNVVEGAGTPKDTAGKKNYNASRLSGDQKKVYNQMVKVHKVMSHEEYFAGLEEIGELS